MVWYPVEHSDSGRATNNGDMRDGTSKTFLITESKEEVWSSWYDGQSAFVTAMALTPSMRTSPQSFNLAVDGMPDFTSVPILQSALNYGPRPDDLTATHVSPERVYWFDFAGGNDARQWGPSSDHTGVVVHGFADGHAIAISDATDRRVVYSYASRAGSENPNESL